MLKHPINVRGYYGRLLGVVEQDGVFALRNVAQQLAYGILEYNSYDELIDKERVIHQNIEDRLGLWRKKIVLDDEPFQIEIKYMNKRGIENIALTSIVEAFYAGIPEALGPYIGENGPNYIVPGWGAEGVVSLDRARGIVEIVEPVEYWFNIFYLDSSIPQITDVEEMKTATEVRLSLEFKDRLEVFRKYLNS